MGDMTFRRDKSSKEYYTPKYIVDNARIVMGGDIDLDPASCDIAQKTIRAIKYYTKYDDGLKYVWYGRIWLNPPYGRGITNRWIQKLINSGDIEQYCCLVNTITDTKYGQQLVKDADVVCFFNGRIKFNTPNGVMVFPPLGNMLCYKGVEVERFYKQFKELGTIMKKL